MKKRKAIVSIEFPNGVRFYAPIKKKGVYKKARTLKLSKVIDKKNSKINIKELQKKGISLE